jgi:hypothetical protein
MTPLERCEAEQREIRERADVRSGLVPAWLVTLGLEDWEMEKRLIEAENRRCTALNSTE